MHRPPGVESMNRRISIEANTYCEIQALSRLTVDRLREKYLDVFGEEGWSHHRGLRFQPYDPNCLWTSKT